MAQKNIPGKTTKSVRISGIVAIACTVMAGIGAIVVATGSANIGESLPPTILFAIAVIISKEDVVGHDAPFPLEKTKFIIGKVQ